ncbi:hypothetical protein [Citrobacter portucalensis]|uniref:hypothetical protein n=1 Tax=Citrobacter portucalensis TaxID=1639133 RepID=UPI0021CB3A3E|nr:hypothetical protein [Citrobacter portucalensis]
MTTNHPAHGPVSLDRLHQIREILSKAAAQSDGGNLGYAMADAVKVINGAIAAFGAEPVAWLHSDNGIGIPAITRSRNVADSWFSKGWNIKPLYTTPPATVVPDEMTPVQASRTYGDEVRGYRDGWNACRSAMLQAVNFREIPNSSTNNCREISETSTNKHEIETHKLLKHIEGMEVSVDVSTCDADAGHRYFGTVTEISELDTAKNGYILLVQDAKPNFKQAGNSPVTPDCYVLVPKEITCAMDDAAWEAYHETRCMSDIWAALLAAAPQQEVKSALEHGMQRYAGAMQKLSEGDD